MRKSLPSVMQNITVKNFIPDIKIRGLSTDSKKVTFGDLFIAIKGERYDGNDYIESAFKNGAVAVLSDSKIESSFGGPIIKVRNARKSLSTVAHNFYGNPSKDIFVIGITGTNGKTSVASILYSIFFSAGINSAQIGTLGFLNNTNDQKSSYTTPEAIELNDYFLKLKKAKSTHVVMEVSSHALDQYRVEKIDFNMAVFTNLTPEHLDYHKTLESYYKTKLKLFKSMSNDSIAVINKSDFHGEKIIKTIKTPTKSYSNTDTGSVHFDSKSVTSSGIKGLIIAGNKEYDIDSNLIGEFNCENILAAVTAAHHIGIGKENIEDGIKNCKPIPGRMESFELLKGATVIIDYAHTPDAYEKSLKAISNIIMDNRFIYVVFGAGGDRDKTKRFEMAKVTERYCKHCFITPDNPRYEDPQEISAQIISGYSKKSKYTIYDDRETGLRRALDIALDGDIVAVLGKGREQYQEIEGRKTFYSDLNIVRDYQ
tara:strand:+ start:3141 stop:4589 length:1449 start_codon:yes stop_codon:yes gene_type:complete